MPDPSSVRRGSPAPPPIAQSHLLSFATSEPIQFIDITDALADLVRQGGLTHGHVTVLARHTTAAVRIQENEPFLLDDLRSFLQQLAPADRGYRHNKFRERTQHMHPDERPNGHAHCLQLLLGSSETIPVIDGELGLGTWQRVFLIELDGPRECREVLVHLSGQAALGPTDDLWSTPFVRPCAPTRLIPVV